MYNVGTKIVTVPVSTLSLPFALHIFQAAFVEFRQVASNESILIIQKLKCLKIYRRFCVLACKN